MKLGTPEISRASNDSMLCKRPNRNFSPSKKNEEKKVFVQDSKKRLIKRTDKKTALLNDGRVYKKQMMNGHVLLTSTLRADVVIKTILRRMRTFFRSRYEKFEKSNEFSQTSLEEFVEASNLAQKVQEWTLNSENKEQVKMEDLTFCLGAMLKHKKMVKGVSPGLQSQVDLIKKAISQFSPSKLQLFEENAPLRCILRFYLEEASDDDLRT